jgi:hypothetical protein
MATDALGPALMLFLASAEAALDTPVGRAALYPGAEVAWDDCCDGQLWIRVINQLPNSGVRNASGQPCGVATWTVTLGLGVLRCAASIDDQGRAPAAADLTANTLAMLADQAALSEAIQCAITPAVEKLVVLRWDPIGPSGGCVGGEWQFTVTLMNCACP